MPYDVFISYPHKDRDAVRPIVAALRACGLDVWQDERDIRDYEGITRAIVEGLARSKALLAYYSEYFAQSRACQWELTAGFLAAQHEGDPRRRVLVVNPETVATHIQPIELRDALFPQAPTPDDPSALQALADSVARHVSEIPGLFGEIRALAMPPWYGGKALGSNRFVGRVTDMWRIHSALHASEVAIITGAAASPVAQVQGMGGVGKSLLAEEYALRFAAAYPGGVFWLRAYGHDDSKGTSNPEQSESERTRQLESFAIDLRLPVQGHPPHEVEAMVVNALTQRNMPFLWIVDDLPSGLERQALEKWVAPNASGRTLITTRSRDYDATGAPLSLDVLTSEEAYQLLTGHREPQGPDEEEAARGLAQDLGCHALAVDVAGAYLACSTEREPYAAFRAGLRNTSEDELELAAEFGGTLPTGHEKSIAATFLRSLRLLGDEGWDVLRLASVLAAAPLPGELIADVFARVDGLDERRAHRRATRGLDQAVRLSLAERVEVSAWSVHTLIARTVRFRDADADRRAALRAAAVAALSAVMPQAADIRTHTQLAALLPHARELTREAGDHSESELLGWLARHDYERGIYVGAEHQWRQVLELERRLLGPEHPRTLTSMNNMSETLRKQGNLVGARALQEQVLEIRRRLLGHEHAHTVDSIASLGETLREQGELNDARKLHERALEIRRRRSGPEHRDTLSSMNNLAETLRAQGDLVGARSLQEQVLEARRRLLGPEHPETVTSLANLAATLWGQGNLEVARQYEEQVLDIRRRLLGPEHPETLTSMNNLAETVRAQGDLQGARALHEQVLETSRRLLGPEHPTTLASMNNLAETLRSQEEFERARKLQEQVLEACRRLLGPEHPTTLASMRNLAGTLLAQGDLVGARELEEQALETSRRLLGHEHPDTLRSMTNLAGTLWAQGDLVGARTLEEQVLETSRRLLGPEHPDTLRSMTNLAGTLRAQGDLVGARELRNRCWRQAAACSAPSTPQRSPR